MKEIIVSCVIAMAPLLQSYRSLIPGVDLATLFFLLLSILALKKRITVQIRNPINYLFYYLLIITPFCLIFPITNELKGYVKLSSVSLRWGKMILLLGIVFYLGLAKFYNEQITLKCMKVLVYSSSIYIIMQRIAFNMGFIITNPFINFARAEAYIGYNMITGSLYRPAAFFFEPAQLSQYFVLYMCYAFFANKKVKIMDILFTVVGILCTGSGMGVVFVIILLILFAIYQSKKKLIHGVLLFGIFVFSASILYRTEFMHMVLERVFTTSSKYGGNAIAARVGKGYEFFQNLPFISKLLGCGYGNVPENVYMNGFEYIINTLGMIGLLILLFSILKLWHVSSNLWKKAIIIMYISMTMVAQLFSPAHLVLIFLLCSNPKCLVQKKFYRESRGG